MKINPCYRTVASLRMNLAFCNLNEINFPKVALDLNPVCNQKTINYVHHAVFLLHIVPTFEFVLSVYTSMPNKVNHRTAGVLSLLFSIYLVSFSLYFLSMAHVWMFVQYKNFHFLVSLVIVNYSFLWWFRRVFLSKANEG